MCGRYNLEDAKEVPKRFNAKISKGIVLKPNNNVAPTQSMAVIIEDSNGDRAIEIMKWGIPRTLGKDLVKELINTKAESAFGGFWKKTVLNQRCLVPANGFYEWRGTKGDKTPFYIHPKNEKLFAFAGIWSTWKNEDGNEIKVYSIMTTEPNKEMKKIHTRAPVMLHEDEESSWLTSSHDDDRLALQAVLRRREDDFLEIYEVGKEVNAVRNNNGKLWSPINSK